jgi:hypothetical protein
MNETKFISDSATRCVGKARDAFRVMGDTVAGLPAGKMPKR